MRERERHTSAPDRDEKTVSLPQRCTDKRGAVASQEDTLRNARITNPVKGGPALERGGRKEGRKGQAVRRTTRKSHDPQSGANHTPLKNTVWDLSVHSEVHNANDIGRVPQDGPPTVRDSVESSSRSLDPATSPPHAPQDNPRHVQCVLHDPWRRQVMLNRRRHDPCGRERGASEAAVGGAGRMAVRRAGPRLAHTVARGARGIPQVKVKKYSVKSHRPGSRRTGLRLSEAVFFPPRDGPRARSPFPHSTQRPLTGTQGPDTHRDSQTGHRNTHSLSGRRAPRTQWGPREAGPRASRK